MTVTNQICALPFPTSTLLESLLFLINGFVVVVGTVYMWISTIIQ